jgi:hypothetical protein
VSQYKVTVSKMMPRKIFGEFMEFLQKGLNSFKNLNQIQMQFISQIFNSNSVGNLNFFPKVKLSLLKLSTTWKSLEKSGE